MIQNTIIKKIKSFIKSNEKTSSSYSYMYDFAEPIWTSRNYQKFAEEAYNKNVIVNRCINVIAQAAASVPWSLYHETKNHKSKISQHPLITLLNRPNPKYGGAEFFENIYAYRMISGNAYILANYSKSTAPIELHVLRPDRVKIVNGNNTIPLGYNYHIAADKTKFYPVNGITGQSKILHLRNFHPLDDWYGLSLVEAASYSIDQHNQASIWNQSLLQNGARPSGAMIINPSYNDGSLSEDQYHRLKNQIEEKYTSSANAGRPLLLEGGLDWREMSLSPKDMDFIEAKNSAARDIALAFGVPPQLLGIPGDNKYSNMQEARLALWEETILPMLDHMTDALNNWLVPMFGNNLYLSYDTDEISVLAPRRENIWSRIQNVNFMTINEKRAAIGLSPLLDGDRITN